MLTCEHDADLGETKSAFYSTAGFDSPGDPLRTVMAEAG
jgi:hypothetical protein